MIDEQSSASGLDYASHRSAIGAGTRGGGGGGGGGGGKVDDSVVGKLHGFALLWAGNGCVLGQATALLCDYIRFSLCLNWDKLLKNVKC